MDNLKSVTKIRKKKLSSLKPQKKDWAQKLANATGKIIEPNRTKPLLGRFVYLLIDCSGSMYGYKINQAKDGALGFAKEALLKNYAVGIIKFASKAEELINPQKKLETIEKAIQKLDANGSTSMSDAIVIATQNLLEKQGERILCIVTDGMPDSKGKTKEASNRAKEMGIELMTIGTDDADKEFLDLLATKYQLSIKVEGTHLRQGIVDMARLLPGK